MRNFEIQQPEFVPKGRLLEKSLTDSLYDYADQSGEAGNEKVFRPSTEDEDLYEGTDMFIYGIPVDITSYIEGKDRTHLFDPVVIIDEQKGYYVQFGVRRGNSKEDFKIPVAVIGLSTYSGQMSRWEIGDITERFQENIEEVITTLEDEYFKYCDEEEIYF